MTSRIHREESGQGLVEYALIIAIVSLGAMVSLGFVSGKINTLFSKAGNSLNTSTIVAGAGGTTTGGGTTTTGGAGSTDTTAPAVAIGSPANGASNVSKSPTYSGSCGTAAGDLGTVTITVVLVAGNPDNGSPHGPFTTSCSSGSWSMRHPGPPLDLKNNRTYAMTATQSDSAGNTASATSTFTVG